MGINGGAKFRDIVWKPDPESIPDAPSREREHVPQSGRQPQPKNKRKVELNHPKRTVVLVDGLNLVVALTSRMGVYTKLVRPNPIPLRSMVFQFLGDWWNRNRFDENDNKVLIVIDGRRPEVKVRGTRRNEVEKLTDAQTVYNNFVNWRPTEEKIKETDNHTWCTKRLQLENVQQL